MKHVLRVINVVAAVIIAVALVVLLRVVFTPAGEVPSVGGYSFMRTLTGSMEPTIPVHSLVVVRQTDPAELAVGDIITYRSTNQALEGSLNTHRITQIDETGGQLSFHTKGDANAVEDTELVASGNVVGRVVFVSAWIGVVASLLSNPLLFFPLIVLPLVILLALEISKMVKQTQEVAQAEDEAALRAAVAYIRKKKQAEEAQRLGLLEDVENEVGEGPGKDAEESGKDAADALGKGREGLGR